MTSSISYYCTDPQLNKISLFQMIKKQNAVNDDVIYTDLMFQTCVFSFCLFSNDYHIYISVPREHNHTCNWLLEWQYEIKIYTDTTTGKAVKGNKMRHLKWKKKTIFRLSVNKYLVLYPGRLLQWTTFANKSSSVLQGKNIQTVNHNL